MFKINKKTQYALTVLKYMQEKESFNESSLTTAREICNSNSIPFDTVSKVMQKLNGSKVLTSIKGINGGYFLSKPLSEISLFEVANTIENKIKADDCKALSGKCDKYFSCDLITPSEKLNSHVNHQLINLSLETLLINEAGFTHE